MRGKIWKKIILSPWILIPAVAAIAAFGVGYPWIAVGACGVAVASFVGLVTFRMDAMRASIEAEMTEQEAAGLDRLLEELAVKLRVDRDYRTKDALSIGRAARETFREVASSNEVPFQTRELQKQFDSLFSAFMEQLRRSLVLFEQADRLVGESRDGVLKERETCVEEIQSAAQQMQKAAEHLENLSRSKREADLAPLQQELEASLRIAKRVEERLREWDTSVSLPERETQ
jgi:signal transduction histidine kinase